MGQGIWTGTGKYHLQVFNEENKVVSEEVIVFTHYAQYTHWIFVNTAKCMRENNYYARVEGSRIS